jgi:hypothetical protein
MVRKKAIVAFLMPIGSTCFLSNNCAACLEKVFKEVLQRDQLMDDLNTKLASFK